MPLAPDKAPRLARADAVTQNVGARRRLSGSVRAAVAGDLPGLKTVIDATGLFPSSMLDDMMASYLGDSCEAAEFWLASVDDGKVSGVAYCARERMTTGTWNLLLIAVHPECQGRGRGAAMMQHVEAKLAAGGERILLVETSALPEFETTRSFYKKLGYHEEARIRDFYQAGEDKIVFRKTIAAPAPKGMT